MTDLSPPAPDNDWHQLRDPSKLRADARCEIEELLACGGAFDVAEIPRYEALVERLCDGDPRDLALATTFCAELCRSGDRAERDGFLMRAGSGERRVRLAACLYRQGTQGGRRDIREPLRIVLGVGRVLTGEVRDEGGVDRVVAAGAESPSFRLATALVGLTPAILRFYSGPRHMYLQLADYVNSQLNVLVLPGHERDFDAALNHRSVAAFSSPLKGLAAAPPPNGYDSDTLDLADRLLDYDRRARHGSARFQLTADATSAAHAAIHGHDAEAEEHLRRAADKLEPSPLTRRYLEVQSGNY